MNFNSFNLSLMEESLDQYMAFIQEAIPSLQGISSNNAIMLNLHDISSAKKKLHALKSTPQTFNPNELKLMYGALSFNRNTLSASLHKMRRSSPERMAIVEKERSCAAMLHELEAHFESAGFDIRNLGWN